MSDTDMTDVEGARPTAAGACAEQIDTDSDTIADSDSDADEKNAFKRTIAKPMRNITPVDQAQSMQFVVADTVKMLSSDTQTQLKATESDNDLRAAIAAIVGPSVFGKPSTDLVSAAAAYVRSATLRTNEPITSSNISFSYGNTVSIILTLLRQYNRRADIYLEADVVYELLLLDVDLLHAKWLYARAIACMQAYTPAALLKESDGMNLNMFWTLPQNVYKKRDVNVLPIVPISVPEVQYPFDAIVNVMTCLDPQQTAVVRALAGVDGDPQQAISNITFAEGTSFESVYSQLLNIQTNIYTVMPQAKYNKSFVLSTTIALDPHVQIGVTEYCAMIAHPDVPSTYIANIVHTLLEYKVCQMPLTSYLHAHRKTPQSPLTVYNCFWRNAANTHVYFATKAYNRGSLAVFAADDSAHSFTIAYASTMAAYRVQAFEKCLDLKPGYGGLLVVPRNSAENFIVRGTAQLLELCSTDEAHIPGEVKQLIIDSIKYSVIWFSDIAHFLASVTESTNVVSKAIIDMFSMSKQSIREIDILMALANKFNSRNDDAYKATIHRLCQCRIGIANKSVFVQRLNTTSELITLEINREVLKVRDNVHVDENYKNKEPFTGKLYRLDLYYMLRLPVLSSAIMRITTEMMNSTLNVLLRERLVETICTIRLKMLSGNRQFEDNLRAQTIRGLVYPQLVASSVEELAAVVADYLQTHDMEPTMVVCCTCIVARVIYENPCRGFAVTAEGCCPGQLEFLADCFKTLREQKSVIRYVFENNVLVKKNATWPEVFACGRLLI